MFFIWQHSPPARTARRLVLPITFGFSGGNVPLCSRTRYVNVRRGVVNPKLLDILRTTLHLYLREEIATG